MRCDILASAGLSRNRFEKLRKHLHTVDVNYPDATDHLGKVRPLLDIFERKCKSLVAGKYLCIDEQMVPLVLDWCPTADGALGVGTNSALGARDGARLYSEPLRACKHLGRSHWHLRGEGLHCHHCRFQNTRGWQKIDLSRVEGLISWDISHFTTKRGKEDSRWKAAQEEPT
ncbi:hypothetical protein HPB51_007014 [Rhipicephalus microplus]|uniref:PiggyBac transposable element-derived protein domain-containing protein n=1 Tax=Rhipicephalus microplus TaxID=6941 RepID=A0A9J6DZK1_RHIMP|nr:hypothetical protein HPB51_007014 [Rhipicephalus microplus]